MGEAGRDFGTVFVYSRDFVTQTKVGFVSDWQFFVDFLSLKIEPQSYSYVIIYEQSES